MLALTRIIHTESKHEINLCFLASLREG